MKPKKVVDSIVKDLSLIWGEMARHMVNKRLADVGATVDTVSEKQMVEVINLLRDKTLFSTLGREKADQKANMYKKWLKGPDN